MRKQSIKRAVLFGVFLLLLFHCCAAWAGANPVTVATGEGSVRVYTSSSGKKAAGVLYDGFGADCSLTAKNGLYSCALTNEYTVWLNAAQATKAEDEQEPPCHILLARVTQTDAPVYATPENKHLTVYHAAGTLVLVYGEFDKDYYISCGWTEGFMPKAALEIVRELTFQQAQSDTWGIPDVSIQTVYTDGGVTVCHSTATGYSEAVSYQWLGDQVKVLTTVGDMAQLANGFFVESRFLDPDGDHSLSYATVISGKILNRLNVRSYASTDAAVVCKLCAGARVQVLDHTEEWASVCVMGEKGGMVYLGAVQMKFLDLAGDSTQSGYTRIRTLYDLGAGNDGNWYRVSWHALPDTLPAGTLLTVIGVEGNYNAEEDYPDAYLCLTEEGRLITLLNDGVVEAVAFTGITVKTTADVRLRAAPSKTADTLKTLSKGVKVEVLLRGEGWTLVQYKDSTGYVMSRYLQFP